MLLSQNTVKILQNYSNINPGIILHQGNFQYTGSPIGSALVTSVTLPEDFPKEIVINDLDKFLKFYKNIKDAEIEFEDDYLTIKNTNESLHFYYGDKDMIVVPKKEPYPHDKIDMDFIVDSEFIQKFKSLSAIASNFKHIKITPLEENVQLTLCNKESENIAEHNYQILVDGSLSNESLRQSSFYLSMETLKAVLEGNYEFYLTVLEINSNFVYLLRMYNTTYNVNYWTSVIKAD